MKKKKEKIGRKGKDESEKEIKEQERLKWGKILTF